MRTTRVGRLSAIVATAALIGTGVPAAEADGTAPPAPSADSFMVTTQSGCTVEVKHGNVERAFNHWVKAGYSKKQSAGIIGNLIVESGLEPTQKQCNGPGMGIAQWGKGGRWDTDTRNNMVWFGKHIGLSHMDYGAQLRFITYELKTFPQYGRSSLKKQDTVKGAMNVFLEKFEGASDPHADRRYKYAKDVYEKYS